MKLHQSILSESLPALASETPTQSIRMLTLGALGIEFQAATTHYVVGRTTPLVTTKPGLSMWRKRLYALLARNTRVGYEYFRVPTHRMLEIGTQVEI